MRTESATAADLLQHLIDVLNVMKHTVIMMAVIITDIRSSMSVKPELAFLIFIAPSPCYNLLMTC